MFYGKPPAHQRKFVKQFISEDMPQNAVKSTFRVVFSGFNNVLLVFLGSRGTNAIVEMADSLWSLEAVSVGSMVKQ